MTGQTDLRTILATMAPRLFETDYGFGTVADAEAAATIPGVIATFAEDEGLSLVAPSAALGAAGIAHSPGWARISLTVHSSLAAVGLTAALASALADAGIGANIVAAHFHDHIFVSWAQRERAMDVLHGLARAAEAG